MKNIKRFSFILACTLIFTGGTPVHAEGLSRNVSMVAEDSGSIMLSESSEVSVVPSVTPVVPEVSPTPSPVPAEQEKPTPENGWYTTKDGMKQYFRNGNFVTGMQTIEKNTYYFDKQGYLLKNSWVQDKGKKYRTDKNGKIIKSKLVTIDKKVYYFGSNGAMFKGWKKFKNGSSYFGSNGARVTGLKKIGKNTYYFNSKGIMQTGTVKVKTTTYYLSDKGVLEAKKVKTKYYDANGKAMSKLKSQDFETLQRAKTIAAGITTSKMTKSQKLKKCFDWVISKPYVTRRQFSNFAGWPAVYANDHFVLGGGNCQADAAAFAYLAKAIGYTEVYVCVDCDGSGGRGHSWAEINGLVYDPLFAEAKNYANNYGVKYGVYKLYPILHILV